MILLLWDIYKKIHKDRKGKEPGYRGWKEVSTSTSDNIFKREDLFWPILLWGLSLWFMNLGKVVNLVGEIHLPISWWPWSRGMKKELSIQYWLQGHVPPSDLTSSARPRLLKIHLLINSTLDWEPGLQYIFSWDIWNNLTEAGSNGTGLWSLPCLQNELEASLGNLVKLFSNKKWKQNWG